MPIAAYKRFGCRNMCNLRWWMSRPNELFRLSFTIMRTYYSYSPLWSIEKMPVGNCWQRSLNRRVFVCFVHEIIDVLWLESDFYGIFISCLMDMVWQYWLLNSRSLLNVCIILTLDTKCYPFVSVQFSHARVKPHAGFPNDSNQMHLCQIHPQMVI